MRSRKAQYVRKEQHNKENRNVNDMLQDLKTLPLQKVIKSIGLRSFILKMQKLLVKIYAKRNVKATWLIQ